MIPVVLDLSCTDDIEARLRRDTPKQRLTKKAVRLCLQAHKQGALLSNCDLAELLNLSDSYVAHLLCAYEKKDDNVIPRRATLHDMGSGLTHKRIICHKRYAQGKRPEQIARETYHALESVDRYLSQYDRVCHCRNQGMQPDQIAYTLKCSVALVREYIQIDEDLDANRCDDQNKTFKGRTR